MSRRRPNLTESASEDPAILEAKLLSFQHQRHSLRISVSNLAALVGFHPYKQVPELVLRLVYQGATGQALLQKDAALLGLALVTPEEQLQELARKAGRATQTALTRAFTTTSDSVEAARVIKQAVVQEAKKTGRLQATELKILEEGVRSAVDTQHGERHEEYALDAYERQIGWSVRMRNAEIRMLAFERLENESIPSVIPLGSAESIFHNTTEMNRDEGLGQAVKRPRVINLTESDVSDDAIADGDEPTSMNEAPNDLSTEKATEMPFFYLLGSIDGLRDELAPNEHARTDDDDSWTLRPVVVECKHRMNRIHKVPPLYEQIQAVAYCFMYGAEHADLVQVMRGPAAAVGETPRDVGAAVDETKVQGDNPIIPGNSHHHRTSDSRPNNDEDTTPKSNNGLVVERNEEESKLPEAEIADVEADLITVNSVSENVALPEVSPPRYQRDQGQCDDQGSTTHDNNAKTDGPLLELAISRVSLDDPIYQHRTQWNQVILPRLRSIVDTVYDIRRDDAKRYQLLAATSSQYDVVLEEAWQLIIAKCPWLEHCDTALSRNMALNRQRL